MKTTKLITTHKRLSLLFTATVFGIVIILGTSILSAKYYHENREQKNNFEVSTQRALKLINAETSIQLFAQLPQALKKKNNIQHIRESFELGNRFSVSLLLLNENKEIIYDSILEKPKFTSLLLDKGDVFYTDEESMVRVVNTRYLGKKVQVVFYKSITYTFSSFVLDIVYLFFMTVLFGILFYFVGYRFVGKALEPVRENLQDMSDFIQNAGHELKTPLAVMRGNLQVMQAEKEYDKKLLKKSIKEVDSMNGLIEGLRELSEVGKLAEKESLALAPEVSRSVRDLTSLIEKKEITVENTVKGIFIVPANKHELGVLLSNIIKNAIHYNTQKGTIKISLDKNILSISDTGVGISEQDQEKIFERFFQTESIRSKRGFGIGLSLVKKIADANNWKIEVESKEGEGATFKIIF